MTSHQITASFSELWQPHPGTILSQHSVSKSEEMLGRTNLDRDLTEDVSVWRLVEISDRVVESTAHRWRGPCESNRGLVQVKQGHNSRPKASKPHILLNGWREGIRCGWEKKEYTVIISEQIVTNLKTNKFFSNMNLGSH